MKQKTKRNSLVTDIAEYTPTPAEIRLMEVLSDPENLDKSVTQKAKLANIARKTYYEIIKKPEFSAYMNKLTYDLIKGRIGEVVEACFKFGTTEKSCFQDRKLLLQMAGMYEDQSTVRIEEHTEVCNASEEELREALLKLEKVKAIDITPTEEE